MAYIGIELLNASPRIILNQTQAFHYSLRGIFGGSAAFVQPDPITIAYGYCRLLAWGQRRISGLRFSPPEK